MFSNISYPTYIPNGSITIFSTSNPRKSPRAEKPQVFTDPADAVLPDDLRDLAKW
jgi:hypothetical protein